MRRYVVLFLLAVVGTASLAGYGLLASSRESATARQDGADRPTARPDGPLLRVVLSSMWAPSSGFLRLNALAECLEEETGRPVKIVQRKDYQEANAVLLAGGAEIGFICSGAVDDERLKNDFNLSFRLRFERGDTYRAVVIVKKDDPATQVADLEGSSFAWVDPNSLTGYFAFRVVLRAQGHDPDSFFGRATFTHGHDRSIRAVQGAVVRAAAVDEEILGLEDTADLKVLWTSSPFPSPPVLVDRSQPDLVEVLERIGQRRECLAPMGAIGLSASSWADYDVVTQIVRNGY